MTKWSFWGWNIYFPREKNWHIKEISFAYGWVNLPANADMRQWFVRMLKNIVSKQYDNVLQSDFSLFLLSLLHSFRVCVWECVFKRVVCSLMGPVFLMSTKLLPFAHSHIRSPSLLLYHPSLSPSPSLHHLNSTSPLHFFLFCSLITLVLSRCISMGVGW